ncbi:MAG TPA: hypothetical protein DER60_03890 [Syntrophomonas sp.]|jgi:flagellar basal-body rod modification protein FlgD|nr:hypothetical protein [Syntrophomonas sp.]
MTVEATAAAANNTAQTAAKSNKSIMDKDDFLKLLVTELRYQNPLQPMEDKEFISQMATFSSLEQMQNLNSTMTGLADTINNRWLPSMMMQQAGQMVGREVAYLYLDENEELQSTVGIVDSVIMRQGTPYLVIQGQEVSMEAVIELGGSVVGMETAYYSQILDKLDQLLKQLGVETEESHD